MRRSPTPTGNEPSLKLDPRKDDATDSLKKSEKPPSVDREQAAFERKMEAGIARWMENH